MSSINNKGTDSWLNNLVGGGSTNNGRVDDIKRRRGGTPSTGGDETLPIQFTVDLGYAKILLNEGTITINQYNALVAGGSAAALAPVLSAKDLALLTNQPVPAAAVPSLYPNWNSTTQFSQGQILQYQPTGCQNMGLYQVTAAPPLGTPPTNAFGVVNGTYFVQLASPGPVVLLDQQVLNPAFPAVTTASTPVTAVVSAPSVQETDGTALAAFIVPAGHRYNILNYRPRPATAGGSMPTDSRVDIDWNCVETATADGTGNMSVVITPKWTQTSKQSAVTSAATNAIAAVGVGTLAARCRVELL
jgi:hypothetical protein